MPVPAISFLSVSYLAFIRVTSHLSQVSMIDISNVAATIDLKAHHDRQSLMLSVGRSCKLLAWLPSSLIGCFSRLYGSETLSVLASFRRSLLDRRFEIWVYLFRTLTDLFRCWIGTESPLYVFSILSTFVVVRDSRFVACWSWAIGLCSDDKATSFKRWDLQSYDWACLRWKRVGQTRSQSNCFRS